MNHTHCWPWGAFVNAVVFSTNTRLIFAGYLGAVVDFARLNKLPACSMTVLLSSCFGMSSKKLTPLSSRKNLQILKSDFAFFTNCSLPFSKSCCVRAYTKVHSSCATKNRAPYEIRSKYGSKEIWNVHRYSVSLESFLQLWRPLCEAMFAQKAAVVSWILQAPCALWFAYERWIEIQKQVTTGLHAAKSCPFLPASGELEIQTV